MHGRGSAVRRPWRADSAIFWTTDSEGALPRIILLRHLLPVGAPGRHAGLSPREDRAGRESDVAVELRPRHKGARVTARVIPSLAIIWHPMPAACFWGRAPSLGFPRPAVGALDQDGTFLWLACCRGATSSACERARGRSPSRKALGDGSSHRPRHDRRSAEPVVVRAQIAE